MVRAKIRHWRDRWAALAAALVAVAAAAMLYGAGVLEESLAISNQRLAALHFQRGQVAFEKGRTGEGLIWMIETWRSAVAAGDPGWKHTARANLAVWQSHDVQLKAVFSIDGVRALAFRPDGKTALHSAATTEQRVTPGTLGATVAGTPPTALSSGQHWRTRARSRP